MFIFLSWAGLIFFIIWFILNLRKRLSKTEKLKKLELKISSKILSKKEMQHVVTEILEEKWANQNEILSLLEDVAYSWDVDWTDSIVLDNDLDFHTLSIADKYLFDSFSTDSGWWYDRVYEYKLDDDNVSIKLVQDITNWIIRLQNWTIYKENIWTSPENTKYYVDEIKKEMKWHKINDLLWIALVYSNSFSKDIFEKFVKNKLKNISKAEKEYESLCKEFWVKIEYDDNWSYKYPYHDLDKNEGFEKVCDDMCKHYWISLRDTKNIIKILNDMANK